MAPKAPEGALSSQLLGVSCRSAAACVAVGLYLNHNGNGVPLAETWNGRTWTTHTVTQSASQKFDASLTGVACPSAKSCLAVGQVNLTVNDGGHTGRAAATRWNGKSWSATTVPGPGKGRASLFTEVSCPAAADWVAVGQAGPFNSDEGSPLAGFWNTRVWTLATP